MSFSFTHFLTAILFLFHEITSEPLLFSNGNPPVQSYFSNTPFSSESEMESFIRNEWRDYPSIDIEPLINPLKEILYSSFNPNQTKIRVCNEMPFSAYKDHSLSKFSDPDQIYVITPSSLVPLKYFKWSMELMTMLNGINGELHDDLATATKNLDALDENGDGEIVKFVKNCQAVVVVPHLFKSNYCIISPLIESYVSLANVSLIKLGTIYLRYNSVKTLIQTNFHPPLNNTWSELENIPISDDEEIPFDNFQTIVENFQKNRSSFYLKSLDEDEPVGEADVPLSHWTVVYDSLNTDVHKYLKWIMSENGSKEYENLPWIGYRMNATIMSRNDIVSIPLPAKILNTSKSHLNDFGMMQNATNDRGISLVPVPSYFSSREGYFPHLNVFDEMSLHHLYHSHHEKVPKSASNFDQTDFFAKGDFDDSFQSDESTNLNGEKKSTIGGRSDTSFDLDGPNVGQIAHISQARRNHLNSTHKYRDNVIKGAQSRIQHRIGPYPGFNSYRSSVLRNPQLKKSPKNGKTSSIRFTGVKHDPITNKKNRNPTVGIFGPLKKNEVRKGQFLVPIKDQLVTSVRNNGIETSTTFRDDLVEELQTTFESSRE